MTRNEIKKLNLSSNTNHLLDIYNNSINYLELGTICFDQLKSLLNYEMINVDEIVDIPIFLNSNFKNKVKSDNLTIKLPFLQFYNYCIKNEAAQMFITHGLIKYRENKKEVYAPLVLIPVGLFFENNRIYIQQTNPPIENLVFLKYLSENKKYSIPQLDNLDNVYNLDKYCMMFNKIDGLKLQHENFLTFGEIIKEEKRINLSKFQNTKNHEDYLFENLYNNSNRYFYSNKYNRNQRYALNQALAGESFVISGRLGTGKTTVLRDIAINFMAFNKKVLYVSNMKSTLDEIYEYFKEEELNYQVANFSNSFSSLYQFEYQKLKLPTQINTMNFDNLILNYKFINEYQKHMSGRILDNRFIEIINELIVLDNNNLKILEISNLDNMYKHEFLRVVRALEKIEYEIREIKNLRDSVWKEIPIINNIKYPNQVISLIHKVQTSFIALNKNVKVLEANFGFKEIRNYAYLKNVIYNFNNLNYKLIPNSWHDGETFELAKIEFHSLKEYILKLEQLNYTLNSKYDNLDSFDIKKEIKTILGDYYTEDDFELINIIVDDRIAIQTKMNKVLNQIEFFSKTTSKIKRLINYDFDVNNEFVEEVLKLSKIILKTNVNSKFIKTILGGKYNETLESSINVLNKYNEHKDSLNNLFNLIEMPNFGSIESTIEIIEKYENNIQIKRSYSRTLNKLKTNNETLYNQILKAIKEYYEINQLIKEEDFKFNELLGYHPDQVYVDDYVYVNEVMNSFKNKTIKTKITRFLKKFDDSNNRKNYYKYFDLFAKSYYKILEIYDDFLEYKFTFPKTEIKEIINDIESFCKYAKSLFISFDNLNHLRVSYDGYTRSEDFFEINDILNKENSIILELKNHKQYKKLFGNLYDDANTNLNELSKQLQIYKQYSDIFIDSEKVVNSLNLLINREIVIVLDSCRQTIDSLTEVFKLYFKIFKNSVSRYYYSSFEENIVYLDKLINKKDDLISYLKITENLQVLSEFGMYDLIDYIINLETTENLANNFKYTYYNVIKDLYLEKYPFLSNTKAFESIISLSIEFEDEMIEAIAEKTFMRIHKNSSGRFNQYGIKNLDYNGFVKRSASTKSLFLTNTYILNKYLDIDNFDLVIIDDAHLFDASEYSYAIEGRQVIIAGEMQLQQAVANNLISRISLNNNLVFNYRYTITPKSLLINLSGLNSPIYENYYDNYGIQVITKDYLEHISILLKEDSHSVFNIFTPSFKKQRQIYSELVNHLIIHGLSDNEIISLLKNNINISDLEEGYLLNADYNVLLLEDYYTIDEDYLVANMFDNLLLCKRRLIIFDSNEYLKNNSSTFITNINSLVANQNIFTRPEGSALITKLIKKLEENNITCYASDLSSFLIRKKSNLIGVSVYWDKIKTNYDILNEFRDYHFLDVEDAKRNMIIWAIDLVNNFEDVLNKILEELKSD